MLLVVSIQPSAAPHVFHRPADLSSNSSMPITVLICGSPVDGFQIVGLFADKGDAESYAEDHSLKDWWVARLLSPEAFAESRRKPAATNAWAYGQNLGPRNGNPHSGPK